MLGGVDHWKQCLYYAFVPGAMEEQVEKRFWAGRGFAIEHRNTFWFYCSLTPLALLAASGQGTAAKVNTVVSVGLLLGGVLSFAEISKHTTRLNRPQDSENHLLAALWKTERKENLQETAREEIALRTVGEEEFRETEEQPFIASSQNEVL